MRANNFASMCRNKTRKVEMRQFLQKDSHQIERKRWLKESDKDQNSSGLKKSLKFTAKLVPIPVSLYCSKNCPDDVNGGYGLDSEIQWVNTMSFHTVVLHSKSLWIRLNNCLHHLTTIGGFIGKTQWRGVRNREE